MRPRSIAGEGREGASGRRDRPAAAPRVGAVVDRLGGFALPCAVALTWAALAGGGDAEALPRVGDRRPKVAAAEAPDGRVVQVQRLGGLTVLVVYEHRDTAELNAALKEELAGLRHDRGFRRRARVVAVADTSGYDFWPARGFAKDAVRKKAQQYGLPIYCDWNGSFRAAFGFRAGTANVVVLSRGGRVLFAREGKLTTVEVQQVVSLLLRGR